MKVLKVDTHLANQITALVQTIIVWIDLLHYNQVDFIKIVLFQVCIIMILW